MVPAPIPKGPMDTTGMSLSPVGGPIGKLLTPLTIGKGKDYSCLTASHNGPILTSEGTSHYIHAPSSERPRLHIVIPT